MKKKYKAKLYIKDIEGFEEEVINECVGIENIVKKLLGKQKKQIKEDVLGLIDEFFKEKQNHFKKPETEINKAILYLLLDLRAELKSKIQGS